MAKLSETVRNFLGFNTLAEDYYEENDETCSDELYEENDAFKSAQSKRLQVNASFDSAGETKSRITNYEQDDESPIKKTRSSSVCENKSRQDTSRMIGMNLSENALSVVLSKPTEYKDCTSICSKLRERTTVVVNFEHLKNKEDKKRILDFIYGCCYAIDGNAQRISEHVYILAPYNVDVYDDVKENLNVESDDEMIL